MVWLYPAALIGLVALAGPIAVHLLRRQQATRMVVPSVRFIHPSDRTAVRLRRISDPLLLLIRAAIVASAVLAVARPLWLTDARIARWENRIARVVVIDSSQSARSIDSRDAIATELATANPARSIETDDLDVGIRRAAAWLGTAPPIRREIVVISDFQRGALEDEVLAQIPAAIGIRFVTAKASTPARPRPDVTLIDVDGSLDAEVVLDPSRTSVVYSRGSDRRTGLDILAPSANERDVSSLLRVVRAVGAFAPGADQPISIQFGGPSQREAKDPASARDWTFGAAQRLLRASSSLNVPLDVSASHGTLMVRSQAAPDSLAAAQILKAALDSRLDPDALAESEPERIPDQTLTAWTRVPAPPDPSQWRQTDESDGRWLWLCALLLLGAETWLRRAAPVERRHVESHAA
jgi:hypothetical protein